MSKNVVSAQLEHSKPCPTCGKWLRKGWKVYKWWPSKEERERYPKVWVCRTCFTKLITGVLRPDPLSESEAPTKVDLTVPVEPPLGVVPPEGKSPMSVRR